MIDVRNTVTDWLRLIRAEYREIPGLQLTKPQARRLWGLDPHTCDVVLDELVATAFLRKTPRETYALGDCAEESSITWVGKTRSAQ